MSKKFLYLSIILSLLILSACSQGEVMKENEREISLTISAAASLNEVLSELKKIYEDEHQNTEVVLNFGGSGGLQQQILQGAPVNIYFSASPDPFQHLLEKGHIDKEYWSNIIGNDLVLVQPVHADSKIDSVDDLANDTIEKIGIGTPEAVPAGSYAKESLDSLQLWDTVEKKIILAKDVRQVLTYVETGNVDVGFIYKSDALQSDKVRIVAEIPQELHKPIVYPVGVIQSSNKNQEVVQFYQFLSTDVAREIFEKYGFRVLE